MGLRNWFGRSKRKPWRIAGFKAEWREPGDSHWTRLDGPELYGNRQSAKRALDRFAKAREGTVQRQVSAVWKQKEKIDYG